jgi:hypothetical protein
MRRFKVTCLIALLASSSPYYLACAAESIPPKAASPADAATVNAVWVEQEIRFNYIGYTTYYSCDSVRDKLVYVLRQIGARPGFTVRNSGCTSNSGPEMITGARIKAAVPRAATPERLAELEKTRSTRELAARVRGNNDTPIEEATAQFPATPRVVRFRGSRNSRIEDGDCELMSQILRQVLIPLGARELPGNRLSCSPRQVSSDSVDISVEILQAPQPDPAPSDKKKKK